jgi:hypothetical protein
MSEIVVDLASAIICFMSTCHPALVGDKTPIGAFSLTHYAVSEPQYGGDILSFAETDDYIFAIHRVIDVKGQRRKDRLQSNDSAQRINVTSGCINVSPEVYKLLLECCTNFSLVIRKINKDYNSLDEQSWEKQQDQPPEPQPVQ